MVLFRDRLFKKAFINVTYLFICEFCMLRVYYLQRIKLPMVSKKRNINFTKQSASISGSARGMSIVLLYNGGMHISNHYPKSREDWINLQQLYEICTHAIVLFYLIHNLTFTLQAAF